MASVIAYLEFWFYVSAPCNYSIKILKGMIVGTGVTQHPQTHHSDFVVIQLEESQLRNPGTILEPSAIRRLYGCHVHAPSIHGGIFVGAGLLWLIVGRWQ
jgi:hypothetical protein